MNKIAALLTVALVTGFVSFQIMDSQPARYVDACAGEQRTADRITSYQCFKVTFEATIEELQSGSITLKEAHVRVIESAKQYFPDFLVHLCRGEQGRTDEERVARNLVGHIAAQEENTPHRRTSACDLAAQLDELLDESFNPNRSGP